MVTERQIREDHNVSAIFLIYPIFSNRNQIGLLWRSACDKVITMTGKKKVGCPCSLVSYSHFSTDRAQYVWVIDQVWGQDDWILAKFFFCVLRDGDEVEVHKLAKKERGQYPAILTEQTWSIKDLLYGSRGNLACGIQRVVPSGQEGSILPARVANHSARFRSSCPPTELPI